MAGRWEGFNFSQETRDISTGRVFGSAYDIWEDIYELIIKDYISDVYSDVIETFLGASIKVLLLGLRVSLHWQTFLALWLGGLRNVPGTEGSLADLQGRDLCPFLPRTWTSGQGEPHREPGTDRGGGARQLQPALHRPVPGDLQLLHSRPVTVHVQGVDLAFPVDNSLQECYRGRHTCLNNDLQGELNHLLLRATEVKTFLTGWYEVGQKLVTLTQLGEDSVDVDEENLWWRNDTSDIKSNQDIEHLVPLLNLPSILTAE